MTKRFANKIAIVTGASLGIGRSTAIQLAEEGAHVIGCSRRKPKLDELAGRISAAGGQFTGYALDVNDALAVERFVEEVIEKFGRLDVLVNNAPSVKGGMIEHTSLDDWQSNFKASVDSVFIATKAAFKAMYQQGSGAVVTVSSVSSLRGGMAASAYSSSKAAINHFTSCAAMEAAPYNVRVNVVAPGSVKTPGLDQATGKSEVMMNTIASSIPMQRHAEPEEIAEAICFLCSDQASFITGIVLPVDGGKTQQLYIPDFDITALDNAKVDS
ncbi:MAG: SDR family NAD(P)-dependent oxidoreductase [Pseudomonadales bacterium]|jgi:NAD(P)-dependent dehydrogenase (short-subunit alcohol dehydrogenase family)|nr:SDR family NAD(P)-dependent oxidoreductase [Pseudomonadales bacterium]